MKDESEKNQKNQKYSLSNIDEETLKIVDAFFRALHLLEEDKLLSKSDLLLITKEFELFYRMAQTTKTPGEFARLVKTVAKANKAMQNQKNN